MIHKRRGRFFLVAGTLLIAAAMGIVGYNLWENRQAGIARDRVVEQLSKELPLLSGQPSPAQSEKRDDGKESNIYLPFPGGSDSVANVQEIVYPDYVLNPNMEMPTKTIDGHEYIGVLFVEAEDLYIPIMSDFDYKHLKINPCRYAGSLYQDNLVLAAHNYATHFGWLYTAAVGDELTFTDMDGNVFRYRIADIEQMRPTEAKRMVESEWALTCFTCSIGNQTRLAVRCERMDG